MSMTTEAPKKKLNRVAALTLAVLVAAGGAVAVPQAASAATKTCTGQGYSCSASVGARSVVHFRAIDAWGAKSTKSFTVKTISGRTLCSGKVTINGGYKTCSTFGYRGSLKITVSKAWDRSLRILY